MKKALLKTVLLAAVMLPFAASSQETLAPNQNPNFAASRSKYMAMSDSINQWHGTTFQQTYKAFDWYENKIERRNARQQFRRDLRMERASRYRYNYHPYGNRYHNSYQYHPYHRNYRNHWFWWF